MNLRLAWTKKVDPFATMRRQKYGARQVTVDGIRFDSTKESLRYRELRLLEKAGLITDLETQPRYPIEVQPIGGGCPIRVGHYTADFRYRVLSDNAIVVEDTKSGPTRTTAYRLRKRLVESIYGIRIREV